MTLEEVRNVFKADRYATSLTGCVIEDVAHQYAKCSLELSDKHLNAVGGIMGGVLFTLADFAFAVATNSDGSLVVSLASQITFLGSVKGDKLFAEATCIKEGRTTCFYIISITDNMGVSIASVSMTGFIKNHV